MVLKSIEKLRGSVQDAVGAGEELAERLAIAEVDALIRDRLRDILIPSIIVGILFGAAEASAILIGDPEVLRLSVTSILLAAALYGGWALLGGLIAILPVIAVWSAVRVGPVKLARLLLYGFFKQRLQTLLTGETNAPSLRGRIVGYALRFSGQPSSLEGVALKLADRIAPRMLRHALTQTVLVLLPVIVAIAYYRLQIFPDIIRTETGLGFWSAFAYPLAAIADTIAGTDFRGQLLNV